MYCVFLHCIGLNGVVDCLYKDVECYLSAHILNVEHCLLFQLAGAAVLVGVDIEVICAETSQTMLTKEEVWLPSKNVTRQPDLTPEIPVFVKGQLYRFQATPWMENILHLSGRMTPTQTGTSNRCLALILSGWASGQQVFFHLKRFP